MATILRDTPQDIGVQTVSGQPGAKGFVAPSPSPSKQYAYFAPESADGTPIDRHSMVPQNPDGTPANDIYEATLYSTQPDVNNPVSANRAQHDQLGSLARLSRGANPIDTDSEITRAQLQRLAPSAGSRNTDAYRQQISLINEQMDRTLIADVENIVTSAKTGSVSVTSVNAAFFNNEKADWSADSKLMACLDDCGETRGDVFQCSSSCYSDSRASL